MRQKLKYAQGATRFEPAYERNVKPLEAVQPEIVPFIDIGVRLGQARVPNEVYAALLNRHLAEQRPASGDRAPSIARDLNGRWSVDLPSCYNTIELTHRWAGGGMSGHKLFEYGLNLQEPTLYENNADGICASVKESSHGRCRWEPGRLAG